MQLRTILTISLAIALLAIVAVALSSQTSNPARASFPGTNGLIAFSHIATSELDARIYTRESNGAFATPLTSPPTDSDDFNPAWNADSSMVAYERSPAGQPSVIRIINADGTGDHAVPNAIGGRPSWSPDGSQLIFDAASQVYKINIDGTGLVNLTTASGLEEGFEADWSPDGTKIVFKTNIGDDGLIYTMNADGSDPTELTPADDLIYGNPDWSPDGSKVVMDVDSRDYDEGDVIVVNADGSGRTNLTADIGDDPGNPSWSPDGQHIVYEVSPIFTFANAQPSGFLPTQLFTMDADGTNKRNITEDNLLIEFDPDWGAIPATPTPSASPTPEPTDTPQPTETPPPGNTQLWGDNDCSGSIGARDNQALLRNVLAQPALSQTEPCPDIGSAPQISFPSSANPLRWGDLDCNGSIGARDNQALLRNVLSQPALSQTEPCPDIGTEVIINIGD